MTCAAFLAQSFCYMTHHHHHHHHYHHIVRDLATKSSTLPIPPPYHHYSHYNLKYHFYTLWKHHWSRAGLVFLEHYLSYSYFSYGLNVYFRTQVSWISFAYCCLVFIHISYPQCCIDINTICVSLASVSMRMPSWLATHFLLCFCYILCTNILRFSTVWSKEETIRFATFDNIITN